MSHVPNSTDNKIQTHMDKTNRREQRTNYMFRRALHVLERIIALLTILALVCALVIEVYQMCTAGMEYFQDMSRMLHNLLTIVVGLEFVRMLIDTTPSNILEVLTVAITRHVILEHGDYWSNLASIACIAGLFAIRRFLIRRSELREDLVEE